nr:hypothetical protein [Tanacetum cinerariifolium]
FWNTAVVKRSGDVTRLQALVDKKRIVIIEEVVRKILQLNDAEGVICLPNKEIFTDLARMGYEKPSTKLTFYKAFFSTQWKVGKGFSGVETPLFENMLVVRDVAEEAEAQVPAQGDDVQEPTVEEVATNVVPPTPTSPLPSSPVIPSSPPHQPPCPPQPQDAEGDTCSALALRVKGLENDKAAQQLEIVKLKARVKKLGKINKVKSSKLRMLKKVGTSQRVKSSDDVENVFNQGRIIIDMDQDEGIELVADQEKDAEVEGRHADKQAEIYNIDLDHSLKVLSMQEDDTESREEMEKEDEEIIKSINETPAQKAAKRRKLSEEAQEDDDLRKRLEIVQDEDDDVFVEATPLAQKTMFEEPDGQDAVLRNQKSVHGLALVKRWKLLTSCGVHVIILS